MTLDRPDMGALSVGIRTDYQATEARSEDCSQLGLGQLVPSSLKVFQHRPTARVLPHALVPERAGELARHLVRVEDGPGGPLKSSDTPYVVRDRPGRDPAFQRRPCLRFVGEGADPCMAVGIRRG